MYLIKTVWLLDFPLVVFGVASKLLSFFLDFFFCLCFEALRKAKSLQRPGLLYIGRKPLSIKEKPINEA